MASWVARLVASPATGTESRARSPLLVYLELARLAEEAVRLQGRSQSFNPRLHRLGIDVAVDDDRRRGGLTGRELIFPGSGSLPWPRCRPAWKRHPRTRC